MRLRISFIFIYIYIYEFKKIQIKTYKYCPISMFLQMERVLSITYAFEKIIVNNHQMSLSRDNKRRLTGVPAKSSEYEKHFNQCPL